MQNLLLGYRDNMRVEIEPGVPLTAKTVADLRALPTWPDGMVLNIHIDLDPPIEHCEGGTGILSTIGLPIRSPCRRMDEGTSGPVPCGLNNQIEIDCAAAASDR